MGFTANDFNGKWKIGEFENSVLTLEHKNGKVCSKEKRFMANSEGFESVTCEKDGKTCINASFGVFTDVIGTPSDDGKCINFTNGMCWKRA